MKKLVSTNLMVIMKAMNNGQVEISVEHYSGITHSKALELAMKQLSGDPIYLRIKPKTKTVL